MRIVVLDGYTLNPGDLSWQGLEALGDCRVYDRTSPAEVVGRALDAEIVLTNKVKLTEEIMAELPRLRYIGVLATGYNVVDLEAATRRGIVVTNIPAYSTDSVAQMVFANRLSSLSARLWESWGWDISVWRSPGWHSLLACVSSP